MNGRFALLVATFVLGCSDDPGVQPFRSPEVASGGETSLGAPSVAGAGGAQSAPCAELLLIPAARVSAPLVAHDTPPPNGTFRACQNDDCIAGLLAGEPAFRPPHRVRVERTPSTLILSWYDWKDGFAPDTYTLSFTPEGGVSRELFAASVSYGVLPVAPDAKGNPNCPAVLFVGSVTLERPVDLSPP